MYRDCINISGSLSNEDEDENGNENIKKAIVFESKHQLYTCITLAVEDVKFCTQSLTKNINIIRL